VIFSGSRLRANGDAPLVGRQAFALGDFGNMRFNVSQGFGRELDDASAAQK
jgi:hypothetical protein